MHKKKILNKKLHQFSLSIIFKAWLYSDLLWFITVEVIFQSLLKHVLQENIISVFLLKKKLCLIQCVTCWFFVIICEIY